MTENLHGSYERAMNDLKDIADGGQRKREANRRGVNALLELSKQRPMDTAGTNNPLADMVLRQVRR